MEIMCAMGPHNAPPRACHYWQMGEGLLMRLCMLEEGLALPVGIRQGVNGKDRLLARLGKIESQIKPFLDDISVDAEFWNQPIMR